MLLLFISFPCHCGTVACWHVGSGVRSALVQEPLTLSRGGTSGGRWFRLKGCGMPGVGFTVVDVLNDNNEPVHMLTPPPATAAAAPPTAADPVAVGKVLRKIRGCSYKHTCAIELSMSAHVNKVKCEQGAI